MKGAKRRRRLVVRRRKRRGEEDEKLVSKIELIGFVAPAAKVFKFIDKKA